MKPIRWPFVWRTDYEAMAAACDIASECLRALEVENELVKRALRECRRQVKTLKGKA